MAEYRFSNATKIRIPPSIIVADNLEQAKRRYMEYLDGAFGDEQYAFYAESKVEVNGKTVVKELGQFEH